MVCDRSSELCRYCVECVFWSAEQETHLHTHTYTHTRMYYIVSIDAGRRGSLIIIFVFFLLLLLFLLFYNIRMDIHIEFPENIYHTIYAVALANVFLFFLRFFSFSAYFYYRYLFFIFSCLARLLRFFLVFFLSFLFHVCIRFIWFFFTWPFVPFLR